MKKNLCFQFFFAFSSWLVILGIHENDKHFFTFECDFFFLFEVLDIRIEKLFLPINSKIFLQLKDKELKFNY